VNADRKAKDWVELKKLEKDYFQELQFWSRQVRMAKRDKTEIRIQCGILMGVLALTFLLLYLCSH